VRAPGRPDALRASSRAAAVAAAVALGARCIDPLIARRIPAWTRTNYRGHPVTLAGGASAVLGSLAGIATLPASATRRAALLTVTAAATAGAYDDLVASHVDAAGDKGLQGHLAALRHRRVSGGVVKVAVIGSAAAVSAAGLTPGHGLSRMLRAGVRAVVIAESANVVNLLDLRPGRAGKVVAGTSLGLLGGPFGGLAGTALGATLAGLSDDLSERTMLGDCGANALGGLLGVRLAAAGDRSVAIAGVALSALTLASERWSFSAVIDSYRPLRVADRLGRRP
jgi:hypothetical protein